MLTVSSEPVHADDPAVAMTPPRALAPRLTAPGLVDCVRTWSEEEFAAAGPAWEALRARSSADPYFMGWDRQWLWWEHHKATLRGQLAILACYAGADLVGIAPFFLRPAAHRSLLRAPRMEILGSAFRTSGAVFSEYLDIIADRAHAGAVIAAVAAHLAADDRWSDLVVANAPVDGHAATLARDYLQGDMLVRVIDPMEAFRVELPRDFASYLASLGGGARRKIWNQRSRLEDPALVIASPQEVHAVFALLEKFHQQRWQAPMYAGVGRGFHDAVTAVMLRRGALRMTTLHSGGRPIAAMHNVRLGDTEYNIRTGFDPGHATGTSPGYLHFGFCLEAASRDGLRRFDLLAGQGRHRNYKKDFGAVERPLRTFHAIRAPRLRLAYQAYEWATRLRRGQTPSGDPT